MVNFPPKPDTGVARSERPLRADSDGPKRPLGHTFRRTAACPHRARTNFDAADSIRKCSEALLVAIDPELPFVSAAAIDRYQPIPDCSH